LARTSTGGLVNRIGIDRLLATGALCAAAFLLVLGGLLGWGGHKLASDVETDLRQLGIVFPQAGPATADPNIGPYINKFAGQQLSTGEQAKAYADHYLAVHLSTDTGGRSYAQLNAAAQLNPGDTMLAEQAEIAFRGEAQRTTLLNAHHDAQIAGLARSGALAATAGALGLSAMAAGILRTLRRAPTDPSPVRSTVPAAATSSVPV
jgi:hypothetical protein